LRAVLFTCAGQRVDIVTAFGKAGAETVAADVNPLAPALYAADRYFLAPLIDDPGYVSALAAAVAELAALVLLPGAEVAERTNDKFETHLFLQERGIGSPAAWLPDELPSDLPYPVLVKARRGFGSRNIFRAEDRGELEFYLARTPADSFVQEVCGGEEFSMDVFCDLEGQCLNSIPRTMIESKGGESIKGMTIADEELVALGRAVSEALGVVGPATVQCFRSAPGDCRVTDVNLRFGGAFPLALAAGGEYPALALALARGERPVPRVGEFREGVVMTRFFSETCLVRGEDGTLSRLSH